MDSTNFCDGHQIRHVIEVIDCEIGITSGLDLRQGFGDLYS